MGERKGAILQIIGRHTIDNRERCHQKKKQYIEENKILCHWSENKSQGSLTVISGRDLKARARTRDP